MKIPLWLIILSVAVNVGLGSLWLRHRQTTTTPGGVDQQSMRVAREATVRNDRQSPVATTVTTDVQTAPPAVEVTWKDLQSTELKELIRKLRSVGCPEETIQDMIVAEVNRRYAARTRELWPDRFKVTEYWKVQKFDPEENRKNRENGRKEREWQKEKSALLVELLGFDPEKKIRQEEGWDEAMDWQQSRVAFLQEAKREAVLKYVEDFDEKMQDFYQRSQGLWDGETRAEQKKLEAEKMQGLAQLLSPEELREFELHSSQLADQLKNDLQNVSLSREQFEAVYDLRKKYGDSIYNYGDLETKEARAQVEANQKALKTEMVAALGPVLGKEYERGQDYSYQQLNRMAKRYDLAADTATKVYDMKETAEQTVKQLQANTDLTDQQRQDTLLQVRQETESALKEALGDKVYKRYQREGGWWINNLAPPQRKPKAKTP